MREVVGDEVLIKASGGINSRTFAYELIEGRVRFGFDPESLEDYI